MQHLFDWEALAAQAARIVAGILEARLPRLSDVSQHMVGTPSANYKAIQRFIEHGIAEQTLYRWRRKYGGLDTGDIQRLKELTSKRPGWSDEAHTIRITATLRLSNYGTPAVIEPPTRATS